MNHVMNTFLCQYDLVFKYNNLSLGATIKF
jgi:hypothetical protein